jgi:hypothetical protein
MPYSRAYFTAMFTLEDCRRFYAEEIRRDSHEQSDSCVVHGVGVCLSKEEAA